MTGKSIFKMEIFKLLKDKFYLTIILGIGIFNILLSILMVAWASGTVGSAIFMSFFTLISIAEFLFIMYYLYRGLARDYETHMMGTMAAALNDRGKLFFSRLGSVLVISLILGGIIYLIPIIITVIPMSFNWNIGIQAVPIFEALHIDNVYLLVLLITQAIAYFLIVILMFTATIITEGRKSSFLLALVFFVGVVIIDALFLLIFNALGTNSTIFLLLTWLFHLLAMGLFTSLGSLFMKKQNL